MYVEAVHHPDVETVCVLGSSSRKKTVVGWEEWKNKSVFLVGVESYGLQPNLQREIEPDSCNIRV
jgi:hypothetical protein